MSMSDLRDMTNNGNSDIAIKKNELKNFLEKYFRTLFNFICQKVIVYSFSLNVNGIINTIRSLDSSTRSLKLLL